MNHILINKVACSKPEEKYQGEDSIYKYISEIFEEVKYCKEITIKHLTKDLLMSKENERHFRKAIECRICYKLCSEKNLSKKLLSYNR